MHAQVKINAERLTEVDTCMSVSSCYFLFVLFLFCVFVQFQRPRGYVIISFYRTD